MIAATTLSSSCLVVIFFFCWKAPIAKGFTGLAPHQQHPQAATRQSLSSSTALVTEAEPLLRTREDTLTQNDPPPAVSPALLRDDDYWHRFAAQYERVQAWKRHLAHEEERQEATLQQREEQLEQERQHYQAQLAPSRQHLAHLKASMSKEFQRRSTIKEQYQRYQMNGKVNITQVLAWMERNPEPEATFLDNNDLSMADQCEMMRRTIQLETLQDRIDEQRAQRQADELQHQELLQQAHEQGQWQLQQAEQEAEQTLTDLREQYQAKLEASDDAVAQLQRDIHRAQHQRLPALDQRLQELERQQQQDEQVSLKSMTVLLLQLVAQRFRFAPLAQALTRVLVLGRAKAAVISSFCHIQRATTRFQQQRRSVEPCQNDYGSAALLAVESC